MTRFLRPSRHLSHHPHNRHSTITQKITPLNAYKRAKASQKLRYNRILEAVALDPGIYSDVEKMALWVVMDCITSRDADMRRIPTEREGCASEDVIHEGHNRATPIVTTDLDSRGATEDCCPPESLHDQNAGNLNVGQQNRVPMEMDTTHSEQQSTEHPPSLAPKQSTPTPTPKPTLQRRSIRKQLPPLQSPSEKLMSLIHKLENLKDLSGDSNEESNSSEMSHSKNHITTTAPHELNPPIDGQTPTSPPEHPTFIHEFHPTVTLSPLNQSELDISKAHSKYLSEFFDLDILQSPVGWKNSQVVNSLKQDSMLLYSSLNLTLPGAPSSRDTLSGFSPPQNSTIQLPSTFNRPCGTDALRLGRRIGRGTFASVYEHKSGVKSFGEALKVQSPSCAWEYYIMREIQERAAVESHRFVSARGCYVFPNASVIVMEQPGSVFDHQQQTSCCTLLHLVNTYRTHSQKHCMPELVALYYLSQELMSLQVLHEKCHIVHSDFKADNILVCHPPLNKLVVDGNSVEASNFPRLKLIDFGRSIDMTLVPSNKSPVLPSVTDCGSSFCLQYAENLPWTFSLDYLYLAETAHLLLFGEYPRKPYPNSAEEFLMQVQRRIPRYQKKRLWMDLFRFLLRENRLVQAQGHPTSLLSIYKEINSEILSKQQRKLMSLLRSEREMMDSVH